MTLKEMFKKVMEEYAEVHGTKCERLSPFYDKWHDLRTNMIKELMDNSGLDFSNTYVSDLKSDGTAKVLGSGIWSNIFGVSIRDQRIPSVSAGVYITYLFNSITHECYLTLVQGSNEYHHSEKKLRARSEALRDMLISELSASGFVTTPPNTGNSSYDAGTIAHKKYTLTTLPDDAGLYADLHAMEKIYRYYLDNIYPIEVSGMASVSACGDTPEVEDITEKEEIDDGAPVAPAASAAGYDYDDPAIVKAGRNLIIYGTPGCGKSHKLNAELASVTEKFRVTFHLDYTYTDFVGQILPEVDAADKVTYKFIPGPFTLALKTAIVNKDKEVALVIEEINRGNAASIFGDLFQLLDRDENGISQYELTNEQITGHLKKELKNYKLDYIKIPANLSLYATMNTGDQNVFTLDTAFKRRWEFEKLSNIFNSDDKHQDKCVPGMCKVTWKTFVETINKHMIGGGTLDSEDKQLGKYFVTENQLVDYDNDDKGKRKKFAYKVLEYLWNDVAKFDRDRWFKTDSCKTLDAVIEKWTNGDGKEVFSSKLEFKEKDPATLAAPAAPADEPTKGAEE